jgi:Domain of Unknown Function (DUF1206)
MDLARDSRRHLRRTAHSRWLGYLGRAGLAAQGACFGIIGTLAILLAVGAGGTATDPQGALNAVARQGWGAVALVLLCFGFAGYAVWRFSQALLDRGRMGRDAGGLFRRAIQLVQGLAYVVLTIGALKTLFGSPPRSGGERRAAAGVFGWPAGRELVGLVGVVLLISAVVTVYWALSRRFTESLATREMDTHTERLVTALGVVGLCALGLVLAVVGWFLLKAAIDFNPTVPVGIGGALSKLARATYGPWLLGITAAGLLVFAVFDLFQARYHQA